VVLDVCVLDCELLEDEEETDDEDDDEDDDVDVGIVEEVEEVAVVVVEEEPVEPDSVVRLDDRVDDPSDEEEEDDDDKDEVDEVEVNREASDEVDVITADINVEEAEVLELKDEDITEVVLVKTEVVLLSPSRILDIIAPTEDGNELMTVVADQPEELVELAEDQVVEFAEKKTAEGRGRDVMVLGVEESKEEIALLTFAVVLDDEAVVALDFVAEDFVTNDFVDDVDLVV